MFRSSEAEDLREEVEILKWEKENLIVKMCNKNKDILGVIKPKVI